MSIVPSSTSTPLNSSISRRRRWARGTPRVWMPTRATVVEVGVALDDLVRDARERAREGVGVEDDAAGRHDRRRSRRGGCRERTAGVLDSCHSFPASLDRVKGTVPRAPYPVRRTASVSASGGRLDGEAGGEPGLGPADHVRRGCGSRAPGVARPRGSTRSRAGRPGSRASSAEGRRAARAGPRAGSGRRPGSRIRGSDSRSSIPTTASIFTTILTSTFSEAWPNSARRSNASR